MYMYICKNENLLYIIYPFLFCVILYYPPFLIFFIVFILVLEFEFKIFDKLFIFVYLFVKYS